MLRTEFCLWSYFRDKDRSQCIQLHFWKPNSSQFTSHVASDVWCFGDSDGLQNTIFQAAYLLLISIMLWHGNNLAPKNINWYFSRKFKTLFIYFVEQDFYQTMKGKIIFQIKISKNNAALSLNSFEVPHFFFEINRLHRSKWISRKKIDPRGLDNLQWAWKSFPLFDW